jgi:hypothetical protein
VTSGGRGKGPTVPRLIALNGLIRVAAAASGQLFAFLIAERIGARDQLSRPTVIADRTSPTRSKVPHTILDVTASK